MLKRTFSLFDGGEGLIVHVLKGGREVGGGGGKKKAETKGRTIAPPAVVVSIIVHVFFFSFRYAVLIGSHDFAFRHCYPHPRSIPSRDWRERSRGIGRAGVIIFESSYCCVITVVNVDISVSPRENSLAFRRWCGFLFPFTPAAKNRYNLASRRICFSFFAYRFPDWSTKPPASTAARSPGDTIAACAWSTGFVIVYTVNSELKRNSIRWYADRYRTRAFSSTRIQELSGAKGRTLGRFTSCRSSHLFPA